jgi:prevent-host-death family protein
LKSLLAGDMLQRGTSGDAMREMTVREANQNFSQVIAAAERGETIVITKNGTPVAKITPQPTDRADDPEWRSTFAALEKSLSSKRASGYRVRTITEDDKYRDGAA